ncbi:hypothetical protein GCM10011506_37760 [Marivirga lumbricoides]|uniref:Copper resistance protein NlpE n=1 Tax=Marivirga lumbricoides TaxID=1046115 RepID=A0ABQ1MWU3_9BACT|nr:hypothetical protein GCM10011506_37760 [Marivirga lumbricoides]
MKKIPYVFWIVFALSACKNEEEESLSDFEETYYEYTYPDCNSSTNPEESCVAWIMFKKDNKADLLLGGDIIYQVQYQGQDDFIAIIFENEAMNEDAEGFKIIDNSTLRRIMYDEIWLKK